MDHHVAPVAGTVRGARRLDRVEHGADPAVADRVDVASGSRAAPAPRSARRTPSAGQNSSPRVSGRFAYGSKNAAVQGSTTSSMYSLIGATRRRSSSRRSRAASNSSRSSSVVPTGWNIAAISRERSRPSSRARSKIQRSSGEFCGSTTVVMPQGRRHVEALQRASVLQLAARSRARRVRAPPGRRGRCPSPRSRPTNPVGSPSASVLTWPNGTSSVSRVMPKRAIASRFSHTLWTSKESRNAGRPPVSPRDRARWGACPAWRRSSSRLPSIHEVLGMRVGVPTDTRADLFERRGALEIHLERVGSEPDVVVAVDEPGKNRTSAGVDHLGGRG